MTPLNCKEEVASLNVPSALPDKTNDSSIQVPVFWQGKIKALKKKKKKKVFLGCTCPRNLLETADYLILE